MKVVVTIVRLLLGAIFVFFGSNLLFHFLPNPPAPAGPMKDYMTVMFITHMFAVIGFFQFVPGLLLLLNRYVPLAIAMLAPMLINIVAFHALVAHEGIFPIPALVVLMWAFLFWHYRASLACLFQAKVVA